MTDGNDPGISDELAAEVDEWFEPLEEFYRLVADEGPLEGEA